MGSDRRSVGDFAWPSPETLQCPYDFYRALRREQPVYKYPGRDEYLVSRWEDIVYVAQHPEIFSSNIVDADADGYKRAHAQETDGSEGRHTPYTMQVTDPPEHRFKRKLGLRLVSHERLQACETAIEKLAEDLVAAFVDRGECEFRSVFSDLLPFYVILDLLGLPRDDIRFLKPWSEQVGAGARYLDAERLAIEAKHVRESNEYVRRALLERHKEPRDDFLTELIQAQIEQDGELDLDYLTSEGNTLLQAGNITTSHMLASTMMLLLQNPPLLERVAADRSLIPALIEESMRLETPVQWLMRIAVRDAEVGGVTIPSGSAIILLWGSGNRDALKFDDPESIRLDRSDIAKHQLGFGRGIHLCIGAPLARLEGRISFEVLLSRLKNIRPSGRTDFTFADNVLSRAPTAVWMRFDRR